MPENNMKFQPMPKRFMVWDKKERYFCYNHDGSHIFNMRDLAVFFVNKAIDGVPYGQFELVQSTNLFDKEGKEIFEGGIIDYNGDGSALGVVVGEDGEWHLKDKNGNLMFLKGAPHQKLVGHILSNPELLEEQ